MYRMAVGHLQAMHNQMLDGIVCGQIAQIDECSTLYIRYTALPQTSDAATLHNLAERMRCTMNTRCLAHQTSPALHLDLHLNQIRGRGKPLGHSAGSDAAQRRFPYGQRLGAILGEFLAHQVIAADPHTTVGDEEQMGGEGGLVKVAQSNAVRHICT